MNIRLEVVIQTTTGRTRHPIIDKVFNYIHLFLNGGQRIFRFVFPSQEAKRHVEPVCGRHKHVIIRGGFNSLSVDPEGIIEIVFQIIGQP